MKTDNVMTEEKLLERCISMQNTLVEITSAPEYYPNLDEDEITEQRLFNLIKLKESIEQIVKDIDPNRFGPIRVSSIHHQEMIVERLDLCTICGHTRCQSDHK